ERVRERRRLLEQRLNGRGRKPLGRGTVSADLERLLVPQGAARVDFDVGALEEASDSTGQTLSPPEHDRVRPQFLPDLREDFLQAAPAEGLDVRIVARGGFHSCAP